MVKVGVVELLCVKENLLCVVALDSVAGKLRVVKPCFHRSVFVHVLVDAYPKVNLWNLRHARKFLLKIVEDGNVIVPMEAAHKEVVGVGAALDVSVFKGLHQKRGRSL